MGQKKIKIEANTVDEAISSGLEQIGLKKEQTYIEIIQEDSSGLFSRKKAIVAIVFDEEDAAKAFEDHWKQKLKNDLHVIYEEEAALIKLDKEFLEQKGLSIEQKTSLLSEALLNLGIDEINPSDLKEICEDLGSHQFYKKVKEFETTKLNKEGASIHLLPSNDMMSCMAMLFFPKEAKEPVTFESILEVLKERGIIKGVYKKSIEHAIALKKNSQFEIAKGKKASPESVSKLELFFQEDERKAFQEMMEFLRIDTREIKDLNVCERNQLLVRVHKGDISAAGYRINGETIFGDGATSTEINLGKNVYWSEDNSEVFSKEAGHIKWNSKDKFLDVEPIYVVEGNIDFSEGNLEGFSGKVIIKGDVMPKFKVCVEGDIEIHGTVEDAIVESSRGSITIMGSVIHHNEGYVRAKKDAHITIAQNATIYADNIFIQKEAMNCTLKASHAIHVEGSPGVVVGGEAFADTLVRAKVIGSANWVKTKIHAGDVKEDQKKLKRLKREIRELKSENEHVQSSIEILEGLKKKKELSESQNEEFEKATHKIEDNTATIKAYENDINALEERIINLKKARVEVIEKIYPQVDLSIYNGYLVPSDEEVYTAFVCRDGRIDKSPL